MNVNYARMKLLVGRMIERIYLEVDVPPTGAAGYVTSGRALTLPVPSGRYAVLCAARVVMDPLGAGRGAVLAGDHPFEVVAGAPGERDTNPSRPGVLCWGNNAGVALAMVIGLTGWCPYGYADMQGDLQSFHILARDLNGETKLTVVVTADSGLTGSKAHVQLEIAYMKPEAALIAILLGEVGKDIAKADTNSKVDVNPIPTLMESIVTTLPVTGIPTPIPSPSTTPQAMVVAQANTPPPPAAPVVRDTLSNVLLPTNDAVGSLTSSGSVVTQQQQSLGNAASIGMAVATGGISLLVGAISKLFGF